MKIVVNGREYSSPDELPAEARAGYERAMSALADKNGNGIPDILEMQLDPATLQAISTAGPGTTVITGQKFIINGREYDSALQMSEGDRRQYEQMQSLLAKSAQSPMRIQLDPLNPAEWTPNRGLLATDPVTILWVGIVLGALLICGVLAVMGGLRWLLPG